MRKYQRRLKTEAGRVRDGWLIELEDGLAVQVTDVKHLANKVSFMTGGTPWTLELDDVIYRVIDMELVEGVGK